MNTQFCIIFKSFNNFFKEFNKLQNLFQRVLIFIYKNIIFNRIIIVIILRFLYKFLIFRAKSIDFIT